MPRRIEDVKGPTIFEKIMQETNDGSLGDVVGAIIENLGEGVTGAPLVQNTPEIVGAPDIATPGGNSSNGISPESPLNPATPPEVIPPPTPS